MKPNLLPRVSLSLAAVLLAGCAGAGAGGRGVPAITSSGLDEVLAHVRAALGWKGNGQGTRALRLTGAAHHRGVDSEFELVLSSRGEFVRTLTGPFAGALGFDGTTVWSRDRTGLTRAAEMEDRDGALLAHWVYTGFWLDASAPLDLALADEDEETVRLAVRVPGTPLHATLEIDRATWRPVNLVRNTDGGPHRWSFADWRAVEGLWLAHSWTARDSGGLTDFYRVRSAGPAPTFVRDPFAFRPRPAGNVRFDPEVDGRLEVKVSARTGHLLVHPLVNGRDVGWFLFDTGAGAMCVDDDAADALGLKAFGEETAVGVAGRTTTRYRQGASFTLGPLTMADPVFVELELSFLSPFAGVEVAGICGYDLLARAVVELAPARGEITVHDPAAFARPGVTWLPLRLDENHPVVEASFEGGHSGPFTLDTGAADTVTFHAPAVERLGLLEERDVRRARTTGVGGSGRGFVGPLAWFELGGHRFETPQVGFSRVETGAFADAYTLGNIGQRFLAPFRLVLDYPHRRIAFVPLADGGGTETDR